jgi:hypothetical protein
MLQRLACQGAEKLIWNHGWTQITALAYPRLSAFICGQQFLTAFCQRIQTLTDSFISRR